MSDQEKAYNVNMLNLVREGLTALSDAQAEKRSLQ
ncbi:MAG: hypothetical protein ACI9LG_002063, partial [Moritella dasanensis]